MKAIETVYNGYRFRSRLEARWAVFFDTLGIEYQYEKEGYDLDRLWYLPDFWLPKQKAWIEIKGQEPTREEEEKCRRLYAQSHNWVHMFVGDIPSIEHPSAIYSYHDDKLPPQRIDDWGWTECPFCREIDIVPESHLLSMRCRCFSKCFNFSNIVNSFGGYKNMPNFVKDKLFCWRNTPRIVEAFTAARQARFEYRR